MSWIFAVTFSMVSLDLDGVVGLDQQMAERTAAERSARVRLVVKLLQRRSNTVLPRRPADLEATRLEIVDRLWHQTPLVWRNDFLVLDLCLDVVDGVVGLDREGDGHQGRSRLSQQQACEQGITRSKEQKHRALSKSSGTTAHEL